MEAEFHIKTRLPVRTDEAVYRTSFSSVGHRMTGSDATASDPRCGNFIAADGFISGRNLEREPHRCIVQGGAIEMRIHPTGSGFEIALIHTGIPPAQLAGYNSGWVGHYLRPMKAYFAATKSPARTPVKKAAARKKVAKKSGRKKATNKKPQRKKSATHHATCH